MDGIMDGAKSIFGHAIHRLQEGVKKGLEEQGVNLTDEQLSTLESQFRAAENPFEGLETRYKQDQYLKEHLDYLVGIPCRIQVLWYSGTPLMWTPWGPGEVSCIERCPLFRGKFTLRKHIWDVAKCPLCRGVLISGVSFKRGSTVLSKV